MNDKSNKSREHDRTRDIPAPKKAEPVVETPVVKAPAPEPVDVQALAATVRTALKNGHPDATKHLDALLTALGA